MIVSLNTYFIVCAVIVLLAISPGLYTRFIKKKGNKMDAIVCLALVLIPINWFTPAIYTVDNCDSYTKEILLFPSSDFSMGRHNYIVNKSNNNLLLEYIPYGNPSADEIKSDISIAPEETKIIPEIHINYVLKQNPESVKIKGDGVVHTRLSCQ